MLPFTDIDFFIFAGIYVLIIWLSQLCFKAINYKIITFVITLLYLLFYFKYTTAALAYWLISFLYIRHLSEKVNHKLISALILAIPMVLFKLHVATSLIYFAGLSFVCFRAIQACIDLEKNEKMDPIHFFNFLFFIPSLYIGPLDRFKRFRDNCMNIAKIDKNIIFQGFENLSKGVLYKFIIAELISRYWLKDKSFEAANIFEQWNDIYAYTFYLFFDFAGYSAMAIGMANLIGIDLPMNFNNPLMSVNPAEFWRKWHASLTNWLTDYFFKPFYKWLGQQKSLKKYALTRQNIAIFFTFFLMGIWNGFESNFVWSGILYGLYSLVHNTYIVECRKKDRDVLFGKLNPVMVKYISMIVLFHFVCFSFYVFSGRL